MWGAWDPMSVVRVNILPESHSSTPAVTYSDQGVTIFNVASTNDIPTHDVFAQATGLSETNQWLAWLIGTVRLQGLSDCVACAAARPALTTIPVYLNATDDSRGTYCMLRLFMEAHPKNCTLLGNLFPPGLNETTPPTFTARPASYWCFTRTGKRPVGDIPAAWCEHTTNVTGWSNMTHLTLGRMDLYWLCATDILRLRLPKHWSGTCTIVRLTVPVTVFVQTSNATNNTAPERARRDTTYPASFDLTQNSPCYIDAIGIPRGVPNEYKLADQIGAGFENIPILSALFPITPNKNVDRINYIHYNVQRLANLTRDAVEGISTQLAATSLMAFQNRVALDMLLAEKGGVCAMFGDQCCTFIPNNTAPDGSVTKALNGLRALSTELKEASGLDNPLEAWMQGLFGRWKALVMAVLTSLACFLAILITCGCCCIPCARTLCLRLIATALEEEEESSDSEIGATLMFSPFQTPEPNVNETYMLRNPPCAIRQSNEPDVSSAPVLSDSPASEPPAEDRDELSMQNLPEQVNPPEQVNLPEQVHLPERIHETDQTESDLPENVCPVEKRNLHDVIQPCDFHDEQLPVLPDVSRSGEEIDETGSGGSEEKRKDELDEMETEGEEETERETGMDASVRRSERTRQPSKRLDYAELGNPLVKVVKSFFHGLITALAADLSEEENPIYPPDLPTQINYI
ncbi:Endogenous retrovirus group V member 2 Env polyprotein [Merluccius polli]|uniref:Endogenous retrovirus group V member 2 Env polyprotein n=1 Tax=Merluccius polli TaxID=89951 RepID=A0AA47M5R2_MERPO|nr:Endogenous retrovirus group V member 2 Env polyprotein [Merluccius polli]